MKFFGLRDPKFFTYITMRKHIRKHEKTIKVACCYNQFSIVLYYYYLQTLVFT